MKFIMSRSALKNLKCEDLRLDIGTAWKIFFNIFTAHALEHTNNQQIFRPISCTLSSNEDQPSHRSFFESIRSVWKSAHNEELSHNHSIRNLCDEIFSMVEEDFSRTIIITCYSYAGKSVKSSCTSCLRNKTLKNGSLSDTKIETNIANRMRRKSFLIDKTKTSRWSRLF